jgi:hypothetical protein
MFVTGRGELVEAYLLDFDGELYGETLEIEFLRRLRGERRFESIDALVEATQDFFDRMNRTPWRTLSIIGANPTAPSPSSARTPHDFCQRT